MQQSLTRDFWSPARLKRISYALLLAILLGFLIAYHNDLDKSSMLKRGDFPGFFVQAVIVSKGAMSELYNPEFQRSIENEIWPSFGGSFYMSVYPAYDAVLLSPLASLSPQTAQFSFTASMLIFFMVTCALIARLNKSFAKNIFANAMFMLCFAPLFYGIFGAQNTALSMLLYAAILFLIRNKSKKDDFLAGIAAGLWLVKPQFGCFILIIFLIARRWTVLAGAVIPALLFYLMAAHAAGTFWVSDWLKALGLFSIQNFISNSAQIVSLTGTAKAVAINFSLNEGGTLVFLAGTASVFLGLVFAIKVWLSSGQESNKDRLFELLLIFGPLLLLISPQTLFYDLGIGLVSLFICLDFEKQKTYWTLLLINLIAGVLTMYRESLALPLFFFFPIGFIFLMQGCSSAQSSHLTT